MIERNVGESSRPFACLSTKYSFRGCILRMGNGLVTGGHTLGAGTAPIYRSEWLVSPLNQRHKSNLILDQDGVFVTTSIRRM